MQDQSQRGAAPNSSNWEAVARLLSRKHERIDPQHALDLLPGLVWRSPCLHVSPVASMQAASAMSGWSMC